MKNPKKILTAAILSTIAIQTCFAGITPYTRTLDSTVVQVYAKAQHFSSTTKQRKIRYVFSVVNKSQSKVYRVVLGEEALNNNDPGIKIADDDGFVVNATAPKNWSVEASRGEEPLASIEWGIPYESWMNNPNFYEQVAQPSYSTWDSYIIESDRRYPSFYKTFVNVGTLLPKEYASTILKFDTIAPTATLSNTVVATPNKAGFYSANLQLVAKDNYDPLPEIVLTSVQDVTTTTVSPSPFGAGYTVNTANNIITGAYPTVITFAADATIAKKYKLTYSITDASDNLKTVSTVVTVPKK